MPPNADFSTNSLQSSPGVLINIVPILSKGSTTLLPCIQIKSHYYLSCMFWPGKPLPCIGQQHVWLKSDLVDLGDPPRILYYLENRHIHLSFHSKQGLLHPCDVRFWNPLEKLDNPQWTCNMVSRLLMRLYDSSLSNYLGAYYSKLIHQYFNSFFNTPLFFNLPFCAKTFLWIRNIQNGMTYLCA